MNIETPEQYEARQQRMNDFFDGLVKKYPEAFDENGKFVDPSKRSPSRPIKVEVSEVEEK